MPEGEYGRPTRAVVEEVGDADGAITMRIAGEIDVSNEAHVRQRLQQALDRSPAKLVIDAGELTFMDSSGLAALVIAARQARALQMRNATPAIRRLIAIAGLSQILGLDADD
jgi:anti-anti-sigma factor